MGRSKAALVAKKLIVFDLDGTLTRSKANLDAWMARLLSKLLERKRVAVIGGGKYGQFRKQFVARLHLPSHLLKNLYLFPTTSMAFYRYSDGWRKVYAKNLYTGEKRKIISAFREAFKETGYRHPRKTYGKIIEDRGTQITFSAAGQKAPIPVKESWNRLNDVRPRLMRALRKHLPGFEVRSGGLTSIDVTRKGIDKAYGLRQIEKRLHVPIKEMLFVGDALYPGGNDYAAKRTGVQCVSVSGPKEAGRLIKSLISG